MNTVNQPMYKWQDLPWKKIERQVFKLQKRIYQASQRGDMKCVHRLQRLLIKSWSTRCLAVRRVTQDNQGKNTAGIDGVKSLDPQQRIKLVRTLKLSQTAQPTRRVWIPKPGTTEKRPLSIPTIRDRAEQTLVKLALEPEWEARFEPNSYGFRPGRSCHDAIEAIFSSIHCKSKYVLDADIAKCFSRINHLALLEKLQTFPTMRRAIQAWLSAGVLEGDVFSPTNEGTPQGGPLSPVLANVALHGLETAVAERHPQARVIRYADDLVALHMDGSEIKAVKRTVSEWLARVGLELKPSKTRITHTLNQHDGNVGFDFLGFHIRQYRMGKTHSGKTSGRNPKLLGFKTIIKPSKEALKRHYQAIQKIVDTHPTTPQARLIGQLNPIIKGWTAYYATVVSKEAFSKMDHLTFVKLRCWARQRHPKRNWQWIAQKYWQVQQGKWNFAPPDEKSLDRHSERPIKRHVKVKGEHSPYNGEWVYWARRMGKHHGIPKRVAILLKRQDGKCAYCGLYFKPEDRMEVDHIIPKSRGGNDNYDNWQLLHTHCHDQKTAADNSLMSSEVLMTSANLLRSRMS